ncbi:heme oxygenase 1, chloroplastic-like [Papaver somniferum]|uniref:heme oxygenase 1, chloroplastic-like n=1 Tax=Papaver somniferum TaxID=3469 RepID=UPI000E6FCD6D|nr:heme oxygenase 1, chloroplastic-like [Papaver somniferum]
MAITTPLSQSNLYSTNNTIIKTPRMIHQIQSNSISLYLRNPAFQNKLWGHRNFCLVQRRGEGGLRTSVITATTAAEKQKKRYPGEGKGFVEEMRFVAMKLHTKDQAKEGEKESQAQPLGRWEPSIDGYIQFLVDSKCVYDTLESIVDKAAVPSYAEFRNTGLERAGALAKDLEWFKERGHAIPEPSNSGLSYSQYLEDLSVKDPQAFLCHFYNVYFAHTAGGRMIGKKVAEMILEKRELEFYKWDGDLKQLLQNVRDKLNIVAESWSREEKNHCLEETEKSFKYSGELLRLILT